MQTINPMPTFRAQLRAYADSYVGADTKDRRLDLASNAGFSAPDRVWTRAFERDLVAITGNPDGEDW